MEAIQDTWVQYWIRKIPGGGHENPLLYSGLEDSMNSAT